MIYTPMTKKAIKVMFEAHKNQVDKNGIPYVFHPFHVAEQMADEKSTIAALLHDVIEDTDYTLKDLQKMGFSNEVCEALSLLTHDYNISYEEYIERIKKNKLAAIVKLADLKHNSDMSRLDYVGESELQRVEKYKNAIALLENNR